MLKKTIKFVDYNGIEREEEYLFNLSKAEIMDMDLTTEGGMIGYINRIVSAQDVPSLVALFKDLIDRSYGVKSPDGRRFMKSPEILADFKQTEAYSELYVELVSNTEAAEKFIQGITPNIEE